MEKKCLFSSIIASGIGVYPIISKLILYLSNLIGERSSILLVNMKK